MITKPFVALFGMSLLSLSGLVSPIQNNLLPAWEVEYVSASTTPVIEKVTLRKELVPICACESTGDVTGVPNHYDKKGNVLHGRINYNDVGACQISTTYWLDLSVKLGYDIYTEEGNFLMANYIYEKQGSTPWDWSKSCWKK